MVSMTPTRSELALDQVGAEVRRLVDSYPSVCLWFLREDYFPRCPAKMRPSGLGPRHRSSSRRRDAERTLSP